MNKITVTTNKKVQILFLTAIAVFAFSCSGRDARWYQNGKGNELSGDTTDPISPDKPIEMPDPASDPFKQPSTPKEDDGGFSASKFGDWRIRAVFDNSNVPTYTFSGTGWSSKDISAQTSLRKPGVKVNQANVYDGPNTSAGTNNISNVKYYQFKNKHPMFPDTYNYNKKPHAERLERFYFYWFEGDTAAPHLSNALIAVDSYSKLVYAYAKPIESKKLIASEPPVPTKWGSFENYSKGPGDKAFKFYEYDPIGYVKADGTVIFYAWYPPLQAAGAYDPKMQYIGKNQVASVSGPGSSPYAPMTIEVNNNQTPVSGDLVVTATRLTNVSSQSYEYESVGSTLGLGWVGAVGNVKPPTEYKFDKKNDLACYVYAMSVRSYAGFAAPKFKTLEHVNEGSSLRARATKTKIEPPKFGFTEGFIPGPCITCGPPNGFGKKPEMNGMTDVFPKCIEKGKSEAFSTKETYNFDKTKSDMTLELKNSLIRYNYESNKYRIDFLERAYGWRLWSDVAAANNIVDEFKFVVGMVVPFKYDRENKLWKVGENTSAGVSETLVAYDKNFTLKNNETKEFVVTVVRKYPGFTDETNKIIYTLSWKEK